MTRRSANLILLLAAFIWGTAFVAQQKAMDSIGPYTFTGIRFLLGALFVLPFAIREHVARPEPLSARTVLLMLAIGIPLFLGANMQQIGLLYTSVTNAGFLTAIYVVLVPVFMIVLVRKTPHWIVWPAGILSLAGTWLLGGGSLIGLSIGDLWVLGSGVFWAIHVVVLGLVASHTGRPVLLACLQFLSCGLIGTFLSPFFETVTLSGLANVWVEIAYAGIMSCGIAYTLQAVAQRYAAPSDAAIILSSESLFAALAGGLIMGDRLTSIGWLGCGLIFIGVLSVELYPVLKRQRAQRA